MAETVLTVDDNFSHILVSDNGDEQNQEYLSLMEVYYDNYVQSHCQHQNNWVQQSQLPKNIVVQDEYFIKKMLQRELEYVAGVKYLMMLTETCIPYQHIRRRTIDWIMKKKEELELGPVSVFLAVNYFDRYSSININPDGCEFNEHLAMACLSLGIKMEAPVPTLQRPIVPNYKVSGMGGEAEAIKQSEADVLKCLKRKLQAITPFALVDYYFYKINSRKKIAPSELKLIVKLTLATLQDIGFLEFRHSEVSAAVAIIVSKEIEAHAIDEDTRDTLNMVKVMKCVRMIEDAARKSK